MKKKSIFLMAVVCICIPLISNAQFESVNNFITPNRTIHWQTGSLPAGSNPIFTTYGKNAMRVNTDTFSVDNLQSKNNVPTHRLLWIKTTGDFDAWTPDYLRPSDTVNKWLGVGSYTPPVNADWNSLSGLSQIMNKPNLSLYYLASNPSGYISSETDPLWSASPSFGITGTNISNWNTAFGWGNHASAGYATASNSMTFTNKAGNIFQWTNDASYLTTETDPLFNSKFSGKSTSDLTEGTNLYYTTGRFNTAFGTKSTTDLVEGTNLYYTAARFNTAFSGKSTSDLTEGSNLYYTSARFNTAFSGKSTTDLTEGTNLYYTAARFNTAFSGKTTTDLTEGTNQYFTNARARSAISLTTTGTSGVATYNSGTGVLNVPNYTFTPTAPTINNNVARSLNSNYTISASQNSRVSYSINVVWNITALVSTASTAFLEYSINNGSSWITVSQVTKNVNLGLIQSGSDDLNLTGEIPFNASPATLVRIRTTSTNSTITYTRGQEVLY